MIEECYLERADDAEDENAVEYHGPDRRSRGTQTDRQPEFIYCGKNGPVLWPRQPTRVHLLW